MLDLDSNPAEFLIMEKYEFEKVEFLFACFSCGAYLLDCIEIMHNICLIPE